MNAPIQQHEPFVPTPVEYFSRPSTLRPGKDKGTSTQPPEFDSGRIAVGASWKYVAVKKGTLAYERSFHPNMQGKLIVE